MTEPSIPTASPVADAQGPLEVLSWVLAASDREEGARHLLGGILGAYRVSGGLVALRTGDSVGVIASRGLPGGWITSWEAQSRGDVRGQLTGSLVQERLEDPPALIDAELKRAGVRSLLTLPLGDAADPSGAVVFASTAAEAFRPADRRALETFAAAFGCWLASRPDQTGPVDPRAKGGGEPGGAPASVAPAGEGPGGGGAEQSLRCSQALLSVIGAPTLVLDSGGRIRELGTGWIPEGGARSADWLGRHVADLFGSDRREVLAALRAAARDGDWAGTLVLHGAPVPLRLHAVRDAASSLEAIVCVRLSPGSGEIRDLFHKIPVGIILVDAHLKILELNPEFAALCGTGTLPENPVGLDVRSLSAFQTREAQTALDGLRESRCFEAVELPLRTSTAEPVTVRVRASELVDGPGRPTGYLLTVLAASGDTQMERLLIRAQKMESIGSFASGLAHDFGNFVSVILGKAGVLRVKLPDDPHIVAELDDIETAAKRAQHLSQELMKFARGGRNRVVTLQLNRLIQEVSSLIRTSVGKKIELEYRLDEGICSVQGDEVEMQQLILNLCLNARDAMPAGGRLTLETKPLSAGELARLPGSEATEGVMLRIRDTGVGMSRDVAERIFEPFFSTKKDQAGTGLGLAMAYGIVRRHRGTIDVQSAPGRGTTFEIALPAAAAGAHAAGHPILVVDDEPAFREMVRLVLEEDGYQVHLAANGVEALKRLREEYAALSLVILDLRMPGVDGLSVLKELRELAPELPVLVATGYASPEEKERALAAGAGKILEKPYRVADLRGALGELLRDRGAAPGAGT